MRKMLLKKKLERQKRRKKMRIKKKLKEVILITLMKMGKQNMETAKLF